MVVFLYFICYSLALLRTEINNHSVLPSKMIYIAQINNVHGGNVIKLPTIDKSEPCLLYISCQSRDWYKIELLDLTLKTPLVQEHPVVLGQFFLLHKREYLPKKCWEPICAIIILVSLIRKHVLITKMLTTPLCSNCLQEY